MRALINLCITVSMFLPMLAVGQSSEALGPSRPTDAAVPAKLRILPEAPSATRDKEGFLLAGVDPDNRLPLPFLKHLASDQMQFWSSPRQLDKNSSSLFAGFLGFTSLLVGGDSWISKQVPDRPDQLKRSQNISNYAAYSLIGVGGGAFLLGKIKNNDHMSETGLLSGEAALNSTAISYLLKGVTRRPRPSEDNGNGTFFQGGNSFPSEHAAVAWSIASVVAHEYPGPLTKFLAYGLASTVTLTRVTGKQHFASDAFVGSALGWYLGRQIYRAHHDTELGGAPWGELVEAKEKGPRNPANMGSPYVPLDSWVYPQFERLAALGYIQSGFLGMRPWTRMECARLLEEATERMQTNDADEDGAGQKLLLSLAEEFRNETARLDGAANLDISLDSIYSRSTGISGTPLHDGFHFGQTLINDYGRPYAEGFNSITGFTSHAVAGPLSFFVRGEYQHAPAVQSYPQSVLEATASVDGTLPLPNGHPQIDRFRLLDSTVAFTFDNVQFSFGKQTLWLGPTEAGPFLFSSNAEPATMLKIDSVSPYRIPWVSRALGSVRSQFFIAQLSGQQWSFSPPALLGPNLVSQPYIHGTKLSFHPTPNLEFGIGFTSQFGGTGNPFTWSNFLKSFYSHRSSGPCCNPAKRLSAFDFTYRVPGVRKWLEFYLDSMVIDEYSPIGSTRPAINPGVYLPQIPKMHGLSLRLEGVTTDLNVPEHFGSGAFYWDERYHSGYTIDGILIGNWVGRRGRGEQSWLTYSFSPRNSIQFGYRHNNVDKAFLGGGQYQDFNIRGDVMLPNGLSLSAFVQAETWHFPVLFPVAQSNITATMQVTWRPHWSKGLRP